MSAGTSGERDADQTAADQTDADPSADPSDAAAQAGQPAEPASEPAWMTSQPPPWPEQPSWPEQPVLSPAEPPAGNGSPVAGTPGDSAPGPGPIPPPPPPPQTYQLPEYEQPGQDYPMGQPYPPGQMYPAGPGYPPYGLQSARLNPVALAALICGIVQFGLGLLIVLNILGAVPAIICGAIGMRQTRQRGERGRGMAIAGLVLGILGVIYWVLIIALIVVVGTSVKSPSG